jgi:hypothetical protein
MGSSVTAWTGVSSELAQQPMLRKRRAKEVATRRHRFLSQRDDTRSSLIVKMARFRKV